MKYLLDLFIFLIPIIKGEAVSNLWLVFVSIYCSMFECLFDSDGIDVVLIILIGWQKMWALKSSATGYLI